VTILARENTVFSMQCQPACSTTSRNSIRQCALLFCDQKYEIHIPLSAMTPIGANHRGQSFRNFREALNFIHEVGEIAGSEGHHPDVQFGWGYATISLQTKKIKGLHENDFIMANKIDCVIAKCFHFTISLSILYRPRYPVSTCSPD
jgi:pterin-4a-carbinolamine dehydratase